jgi:ElaB/YqjD/DUF883 family membrane-anchored ribosome-binding protein
MDEELNHKYQFELAMELVRCNLKQIEHDIAYIYESDGDYSYRKLDKLKRDTEALLNQVTARTEDEELVASELKFKLVEIMSNYYNIYYALK